MLKHKEGFISIGDRLAENMAVLSLNAFKLFALLTQKIKRRASREPTEASNPFKLTYQDFIKFGVPRASFNLGIEELIKKDLSELREHKGINNAS